jgi:hypothetical protein
MYEVPYAAPRRALRKHPDAPIHRALVVGCGGGNDVAMALAKGVEHVDAVDINPWVIAMGKEHHPLHPFASDKVATYVADGREFLARGGEKYDLIVYGLPDSTFTNDRANLRVESFIFTSEAFRNVSRLSENGVFVLQLLSSVVAPGEDPGDASCGLGAGAVPATLPSHRVVACGHGRAVLAGTVAFSPIFCANALFANIFRSTREGRVSYAFNLLGGMLGGLFEYASLLLGYRALIGLATVFYLFALLFAYRYSRSDASPRGAT